MTLVFGYIYRESVHIIVDSAVTKTVPLENSGTTEKGFNCFGEIQEENDDISYVHLRYINPLPLDLGDIISRFDQVVVPELNLGQLIKIIRDKYAIDAKGINKIEGKPFKVSEMVEQLKSFL